MLTIQISDANNKATQVENMTIIYDMVDMPMNPPDNAIEDKGNGLYEKKIFLGMRGGWKFDFKINEQASGEDTYSKTQVVK